MQDMVHWWPAVGLYDCFHLQSGSPHPGSIPQNHASILEPEALHPWPGQCASSLTVDLRTGVPDWDASQCLKDHPGRMCDDYGVQYLGQDHCSGHMYGGVLFPHAGHIMLLL